MSATKVQSSTSVSQNTAPTIEYAISKSQLEDLREGIVANCLYWTVEEVANWIEELGFPFYRECLVNNFVNGRKLINVTGSTLPHMGITDFDHIQMITKAIREMLKLEEPYWNVSISKPPRDPLGMYIKRKSITGQRTDATTYAKFIQDTEGVIWQPPLTNVYFAQHHD